MNVQWSAVVLACGLGLAACLDDGRAPGEATPTPSDQLQLQRSADCAALQATLEQSWVASLLREPWRYQCPGCELADDVVVGAPGAGSDAAPAPDDVSTTNVQEAGVDEADLVKADADGTLYLALENLLLIARGFPPAALAQLGSLEFDTPARGLYLDEPHRRVVLIAPDPDYAALGQPVPMPVAQAPVRLPTDPQTRLWFVDVANPTAPALTRELAIAGDHIATRRTGGQVHLVSRYHLPLPARLSEHERLWQLIEEYQTTPDQVARDALAAAIRGTVHEALTDLALPDLLPTIAFNGNEPRPLLGCSDVYHSEVALLTPHLLSVTSVDTDGSNPRSVAVLGSGTQVYASPGALYVAQPSWGWWWRDQRVEQTAIHRFSIDDTGPGYRASGSVAGHTHNAFSFSEHDGFLRVATTQRRAGAAVNSTNHLFVLTDDGRGKLVVAGEVEGYAPGERIFGVRFLGTRGFVVTFRQIDPLFAFDLSDPHTPRLLGELEIPGFSTYLHPLGEDHLLTIGRAGTATGAGNEVQLQIFDITDLTQPRRLHSHVPRTGPDTWSWSEAAYDHHAFTYYAPLEVLSIPFTYADHGRGGALFNGFIAFDVDVAEGISELGRVDHADLAAAAYCPHPDSPHYACAEGGFALRWLARPRRSLIMTDDSDAWLYSVSNVGLKASPLDDLASTTARIVFPAPDYWDYVH